LNGGGGTSSFGKWGAEMQPFQRTFAYNAKKNTVRRWRGEKGVAAKRGVGGGRRPNNPKKLPCRWAYFCTRTGIGDRADSKKTRQYKKTHHHERARKRKNDGQGKMGRMPPIPRKSWGGAARIPKKKKKIRQPHVGSGGWRV